MFKLKLTALGHPHPDTFNHEDEKQYRSAVLWLEDQKIRHYTIEDREGLRNIESDSWLKAYNTYQRDLISPFAEGTPAEQLNWLLAYAVRLDYADNIDKYKNANYNEPITAAPKVVSTNPLDKFNFNAPDFQANIDLLCKKFDVLPHPDYRVRLNAVTKILKAAPHQPQSATEQPVNDPVDVLKLLFVQDVRELQTKINEALVAVQKVTADPRTDTKLGRVGVK